MSPRKKTSAQQKKRTTKKSASTTRSAKSSTPKKSTSQANKRHSSSTVKPSSNKPRPVGKAGSKRKKQSADTLMNTFVFGIVVFLALCAINLIGTTEQIEEPPTQSVTYQVGDPKDFFDTLGPIAAEYKSYGLYPSVMLAQAALESQFGESQLSFDYHNYFGIKAHGHHRSVRLSTTEYYTDEPTTITDSFCVYNSPNDCFQDYAELLTENENYSDAIGAASPAMAARALQEGGYATDPAYASKLVQLINEYNLTRFDPMERPRPDKQATMATHNSTDITAEKGE